MDGARTYEEPAGLRTDVNFEGQIPAVQKFGHSSKEL